MLAMIDGPDILIVLLVIVVLFGSTQIPKLARSLGTVSREFKRGQYEEAGIETPTASASEDGASHVTPGR